MPTRTFQPIEALPLPDEVLRGWADIPTTIASDVSGGRLLMDAQYSAAAAPRRCSVAGPSCDCLV